MAEVGNPSQNAYPESFMKTLKTEEVFVNEYRTLEEARTQLEQFLVISVASIRLWALVLLTNVNNDIPSNCSPEREPGVVLWVQPKS